MVVGGSRPINRSSGSFLESRGSIPPRAMKRRSPCSVLCRVGRGKPPTPPALLAMLDTGEAAPTEAFNDAAELTRYSVFQADPRRAAISDSAHSTDQSERRPGAALQEDQDVPLENHPDQPFLRFTDE